MVLSPRSRCLAVASMTKTSIAAKAVAAAAISEVSMLSSRRYTSSLQWVQAKHGYGGSFPKEPIDATAAIMPPASRLETLRVGISTEPVPAMLGIAGLVGATFFASKAISAFEDYQKEKAARAEEKAEAMEDTPLPEDGPRRGGIRSFKSQIAPEKSEEE